MFLIDSLKYLTFETTKIEEMENYYSNILGLVPTEIELPHEIWLGITSDEPCLVLRESNESKLGEIGFGVSSETNWDQIIKNLEEYQVSYETYTDKHYGETLSFNDKDGHPIKLHFSSAKRKLKNNVTPRFGPILESLHHVTYASPAPYELAEFYKNVLGFAISDMVEGGNFIWLRTNEEHHTIAAAAHTEAGLDHFAFSLKNWNAFKEWGDYLGKNDIDVVWGPGRHGPGNNLFIFTIDPDGNRVEYSAEIEQFHDRHMHYTPRVWKKSPKTVNLWGPGAPWERKLPNLKR